MRANEFLSELWTQPYALTSRAIGPASWEYYFDTKDNRSGRIVFDSLLDTDQGGLHVVLVIVHFYINNLYHTSGKGDAIAIFSTVVSACRDYLRRYRPPVVVFETDDEKKRNLYVKMSRMFTDYVPYPNWRKDPVVGDAILDSLTDGVPEDAVVLHRRDYVPEKTRVYVDEQSVEEGFGGRKFVKPNFDFEWEEAERYPEFVKLGKNAWIKLARKGRAVTITSARGINNTDAGNPDSFKSLDPAKQKRALAQLETGTIEMPIVAVYSDGHKELVGGNTRLTAMMARDGQATVWAFQVPGQRGVAEGYDSTTFKLPRRKLNVPALIKAGAIFVTYPHGEDGWETDNNEDWAYSLLSLYNVEHGGWPSEAKKYLKPESYKKAERQINSSAPNLGSDQLVYDGKYNQILWSIKKLSIPDEIAFLDKGQQGVAENFNNDIKVDYHWHRGNLVVVARGNKNKKLGSVVFINYGTKEQPKFKGESLFVDERYRRQGIATMMYDVAKQVLGKIYPSDAQTPQGKKFWQGKEVWEERPLSELKRNDYYRGDNDDNLIPWADALAAIKQFAEDSLAIDFQELDGGRTAMTTWGPEFVYPYASFTMFLSPHGDGEMYGMLMGMYEDGKFDVMQDFKVPCSYNGVDYAARVYMNVRG